MNRLFNVLGRLRYFAHFLLKTKRYCLTKRLLNYLESSNSIAFDKQDMMSFLRKNIVGVYNYDYINDYKFKLFIVHKDSKNGLKYVITPENRRLYFKRSMSYIEVMQMYAFISSELDTRSPHSYFFNGINTEKPLFVADIGSAEGNFSLKIIDKIEQLYLFERNEEWIEALQATFQPWIDKVQIVNKYVADKTTENEVSIDDFFENKNISLLKMDVEGAELAVLRGAKKTLAQQDMQILMCAYHKAEDENILSGFVAQYGYASKLSNGYMFPVWDYLDNSAKIFQFRKGVIYANRNA